MPLLNQLQAGDLAPYTFGDVELSHCHSKVGTATKAKKARTAHGEAVKAGRGKRHVAKLHKTATELEEKSAKHYETSARTTADVQRRLDLPKGTRGRIEGTSARAKAKRRIKSGTARQASIGKPKKKKAAKKKAAKKKVAKRKPAKKAAKRKPAKKKSKAKRARSK